MSRLCLIQFLGESTSHHPWRQDLSDKSTILQGLLFIGHLSFPNTYVAKPVTIHTAQTLCMAPHKTCSSTIRTPPPRHIESWQPKQKITLIFHNSKHTTSLLDQAWVVMRPPPPQNEVDTINSTIVAIGHDLPLLTGIGGMGEGWGITVGEDLW